jgi:phage-related protein
VDALKKELQEQLDGEITTWFFAGVPTTENAPAKDWAEVDQEKHLGDLYYDLNTQYVYRWSQNSSDKSFGWQQETN